MFTHLDDITRETLGNIRDRLAMDIDQKNHIDTGDLLNSFEIRGNQLLANSYIEQLTYGRRPGKFPPVNNIIDWVKRKLGIEDSKAKSIAFLIGRKIANEGTDPLTNHNKRVDTDEIIDEEINKMTDKIGDAMAAYVLQFGIGK